MWTEKTNFYRIEALELMFCKTLNFLVCFIEFVIPFKPEDDWYFQSISL